jgi:hypothetical protein
MLRLLTTALFLLLTATAALAFGVSPGTHNLGSEHERITRAAVKDLEPETLDALAGNGDKPGAVGVSDDSGGRSDRAELHCDGGGTSAEAKSGDLQPADTGEATLVACRAFIERSIDNAVKWAVALAKPTQENTSLDCAFNGRGGSAKCNVLEHLGLALHASQDFYARTNWVDQPAKGEPLTAENPPGLAQSGRAAWLDLRNKVPFPAGLINGCPGDLSVAGITFGCEQDEASASAGGIRVLNKYLAKDTGPIGLGKGGIGTSPRGAINGNFARAVSAAVEDTADKWAYFLERVRSKYGAVRGARIMCALTHDNYDTARCATMLIQSQACAAREASALSSKSLTAAPLAEPSSVEITEAEKLYPGLASFCVIEEADLTRSEVSQGHTADDGRSMARERALRALSLWNACPAELERTLPETTMRNSSAYKELSNRTGPNSPTNSSMLADIYADCVLGVHLRRLKP